MPDGTPNEILAGKKFDGMRGSLMMIKTIHSSKAQAPGGAGGRSAAILIYPIRIALIVLVTLTTTARLPADDTDDAEEQRAKDVSFLEVVLRIDNPDLLKTPAIQAKLKGVLDRTRGLDQFLEVIDKLQLKQRSDDLLAMAVAKPNAQSGVNAARLLLKFGQSAQLVKAINGKDTKRAAAAINVLGNSGDKKAYELLGAVIIDLKRAKFQRSTAVTALGRSVFGQRQILKLAVDGKLPKDLHLVAGASLSVSPDAKIRQEAAKHIKMPKGQDNQSLPPLSELVKRRGKVANGRAIFKKAQCITCHKLGAEGVEFGPSLAEIGSKLPREALYVAILDPNAGVNFGFEGYQVITADGLTLVGYIISETDEQIVLKRQGGLNTPIKKDDILEKKKLPQSLMPTNLQAGISTAELVDLIEYLITLKKKK